MPLDWTLRDSDDPTVRQEFVNRAILTHMGLVHHIARTFPKFLPYEDLVSYGIFGLMTAIEKYDVTRGFKFSAMAGNWVTQAMQRACMAHSRTIRIPEYRWHWRGWSKNNDGIEFQPIKQLHPWTKGRHEEGYLNAEDAEMQRVVMRKVCKLLSETERYVIIRFFGLDGNGPTSSTIIGKHLGISRERVRQIRNTAERKLRSGW